MVRVRDLVDTAMEASVVPSFSRAGHAVRRRLFEWQPLPRADSRVCVVTGANSGLGYATAALRAILPEARAEGLARVEITTEPDNVASQRVIEANGGVLVERYRRPPQLGGTPALRYRVDLAPRA